MKKIFTVVVWVCLCTFAAFGQGSQRQSAAISLRGEPIPGASVWACQAGSAPNYATTPPCALANIYSDPSLGAQSLVSQPVIADGLGNYTYYAAAGTYVEVITGSNTTGYSATIVLPCVPNSTAGGCGGGAAGNPAGSDTQVEINSHGAFGAEAGFGVDSSASPTLLSIPWNHLHLGAANYDDVSTTALTANRTTTVPDANTVLPQAFTAASHHWLTGLNGTSGAFSSAQPDFSDLSGSLACSQLPAISGDVANFGCTTSVAKIQSVPISTSAPVAGQILTDVGGTWTPKSPQQGEDDQTGATYTIPNTDGGAIVYQTNAGAIADTVPDGTASGFGQGFYFVIWNGNAAGGSSIAVNRQASGQFSVDGGAPTTSFELNPRQHAYLYCYDGTNWRVLIEANPSLYGEQAQADYTGRTTAIASTTLLTPASAGGYEFTASLSCDTATASATVNVTVAWTDPSSTAQTATSGNVTCTTLGSGSYVQFRQAMNVKAGTAVAFSTSISGSPTYTLRAKLEGAY